jgi:hypothetical protein
VPAQSHCPRAATAESDSNPILELRTNPASNRIGRVSICRTNHGRAAVRSRNSPTAKSCGGPRCELAAKIASAARSSMRELVPCRALVLPHPNHGSCGEQTDMKRAGFRIMIGLTISSSALAHFADFKSPGPGMHFSVGEPVIVFADLFDDFNNHGVIVCPGSQTVLDNNGVPGLRSVRAAARRPAGRSCRCSPTARSRPTASRKRARWRAARISTAT